MKDFEEIIKDKKKVLFVTPHPDDVDVLFGGFITKLRKRNITCYVLILTDGSKGSKYNKMDEEELAQLRAKEQVKSLKNANVSKQRVFFVGEKDGALEAHIPLIEKITFYIRKLKPDLVATFYPENQIVLN